MDAIGGCFKSYVKVREEGEQNAIAHHTLFIDVDGGRIEMSSTPMLEILAFCIPVRKSSDLVCGPLEDMALNVEFEFRRMSCFSLTRLLE